MRSSLAVGIGCRRGVSADDVELAVRKALGLLDIAHIGLVSTIQAKIEEPGIVGFCHGHKLPLHGIDAALINGLLPYRNDTVSPAVYRAVGVHAVCEPCAIIASGGGKLIVQKTSLAGVSVAIACTCSDTDPSLSRNIDQP